MRGSQASPSDAFHQAPAARRSSTPRTAATSQHVPGSGQLMRLRAAALGRVQVKATRSDVLQRDGPDHHHNDDLVTACVSIALEYRGRFAGGGSFMAPRDRHHEGRISALVRRGDYQGAMAMLNDATRLPALWRWYAAGRLSRNH